MSSPTPMTSRAPASTTRVNSDRASKTTAGATVAIADFRLRRRGAARQAGWTVGGTDHGIALDGSRAGRRGLWTRLSRRRLGRQHRKPLDLRPLRPALCRAGRGHLHLLRGGRADQRHQLSERRCHRLRLRPRAPLGDEIKTAKSATHAAASSTMPATMSAASPASSPAAPSETGPTPTTTSTG